MSSRARYLQLLELAALLQPLFSRHCVMWTNGYGQLLTCDWGEDVDPYFVRDKIAYRVAGVVLWWEHFSVQKCVWCIFFRQYYSSYQSVEFASSFILQWEQKQKDKITVYFQNRPHNYYLFTCMRNSIAIWYHITRYLIPSSIL